MRNSWTGRLLAVALIGGGGISMLAAAPGPVSAGDASSETVVGLNNTTANEQTCSEVPGLEGPAWHFVAPSGTILNIISLTVGGSTYTDPGFLSYPSGQHAYVEVRDGDAIEDLTAGLFEITGTDKVVLSHTCSGVTTTTTTTEKATTTTEKATTTTEKATTTTEKATTTTEKATTTTDEATTTTDEATTTTDEATTTIASKTVSTAVAAGGPTTAPTTTLALATQLPATGSSSWTLFFVGLASALGGLGLIRVSRRPV
jgi:LPXTG-motif cell wall-anchored protein